MTGRSCFLLLAAATLLAAIPASLRGAPPRPNVILVITDDQGYGDLAAHGNAMIRTPHLDQLHQQSVRLTDFHVDPTCSPTRAALMTGRYSTRAGVWHTIMGRSLMRGEEVTLAEVLQSAGYRTAMFGKWHLGDNYPCRPIDQGFQTAFYHGGGGVGQTPDYFGNDYFDDTYFRDGKPEPQRGYCTDVWFNAALEFIESSANRDEPFFCYLSTNAPHGPYRVPQSYSGPYVERGVPKPMAAFYGMITCIDDNMGRLMQRLQQLQLEQNTLLIFMTDNGTAAGFAPPPPQAAAEPAATASWRGFNAGMSGKKGSNLDGGHRVPCFWRWPAGGLMGGRDIDRLTAHIDILPTLAELCQAEPRLSVDGRSLAPLLAQHDAPWPDRTVFVHSQRLEWPRKFRNFAVLTDHYRLVGNDASRQLHAIAADPGQHENVLDQHPDVAAALEAAYDRWYTTLPKVGFARIVLGHPAENPSRLTCHDWHTDDGPVPWDQSHLRSGMKANGFWAVKVHQPGRYRVTLRRWPEYQPGPLAASQAQLQVGPIEQSKQVEPEQTSVEFLVELPAGDAKLSTKLIRADQECGAYFVEVQRLEER